MSRRHVGFAGVPQSPAIAHASAFVRAPGEDRIAIIEHEAALVVIVADGAGGLAGGARAAELVIEVVREAIRAPAFDLGRAEAWTELLSRADGALETDRVAGESTVVVIAVGSSGVITGASCGDSRAWLLDADGQGQIDDLTAGQHRKLRLGSGRARPVSFSRSKLDGTLLVATDGLFNYARPDEIAAIARQSDLEQAARALIQGVRLPSGSLQDDVALVLARPQ